MIIFVDKDHFVNVTLVFDDINLQKFTTEQNLQQNKIYNRTNLQQIKTSKYDFKIKPKSQKKK